MSFIITIRNVQRLLSCYYKWFFLKIWKVGERTLRNFYSGIIFKTSELFISILFHIGRKMVQTSNKLRRNGTEGREWFLKVSTHILQRYGDKNYICLSMVIENGSLHNWLGVEVMRHCDRWQNTFVIRDRGAT